MVQLLTRGVSDTQTCFQCKADSHPRTAEAHQTSDSTCLEVSTPLSRRSLRSTESTPWLQVVRKASTWYSSRRPFTLHLFILRFIALVYEILRHQVPQKFQHAQDIVKGVVLGCSIRSSDMIQQTQKDGHTTATDRCVLSFLTILIAK